MIYRGIVVQQLPDSPEIVLFAAPASEIAAWAGVPQRRRVTTGDSSVETAGFQREQKAGRVADLAAFMRDHRNVIQNPLLAAIQDPDGNKLVIHKLKDACSRKSLLLPSPFPTRSGRENFTRKSSS